jgi:hypothetical protein
MEPQRNEVPVAEAAAGEAAATATVEKAGLQRVLSLGACFAIGRGAIEKVGYFDENFWPAYLEDFDYHYRLGLAGIPLLCDERTLLEHQRSATVRRDRLLGLLHPERLSRNQRYYRRKWGGAPDQEQYLNPFNNRSLPYFIGEKQHAAPYDPEYDRGDLSYSHLGFLDQNFAEELLATLYRYAGNFRCCLEWGTGESTAIFVEYAKAQHTEYMLSIDYDMPRLRRAVNNIPKYSFLHFRHFEALEEMPGRTGADAISDGSGGGGDRGGSGSSGSDGRDVDYVSYPVTCGMRFDIVVVAGRWRVECALAAASSLASDGLVIVDKAGLAGPSRSSSLQQLLSSQAIGAPASIGLLLVEWERSHERILREIYEVIEQTGRLLVLRLKSPSTGGASVGVGNAGDAGP